MLLLCLYNQATEKRPTVSEQVRVCEVSDRARMDSLLRQSSARLCIVHGGENEANFLPGELEHDFYLRSAYYVRLTLKFQIIW